jgi:hypothetical protein
VNSAIDPYDLRPKVKGILGRSKESGSFDLCIHDGVLNELETSNNMLVMLNNAVGVKQRESSVRNK